MLNLDSEVWNVFTINYFLTMYECLSSGLKNWFSWWCTKHGLWCQRFAFTCQLHSLVAVWLWESYFRSLLSHLFIHKKEIMIEPAMLILKIKTDKWWKACTRHSHSMQCGHNLVIENSKSTIPLSDVFTLNAFTCLKEDKTPGFYTDLQNYFLIKPLRR